ncbi:MgtC/SapB transporter [Thermodesulfatator indicus DSM 15286]|uniref:MgtC/SapB transporter n=1 Tax=Thermodesulfatator indicus (strain DSM 15286 / JCM 11887 / CIR29812) TaxID=667014 RepID=F8A8F4_THEID|nr:MgtC/SapB family protein [Thermodesulfatator indicus]AEH43958.1 MgtC/SapB transporter [Thermodesulfatator indicus DSM 15286]
MTEFWQIFDKTLLFEELGKLLLAATLGAIIGYEREKHGQAAGFRTNIIVATSSCLLMILSFLIVERFGGEPSTISLRLDPARIPSYAVAGMGFLGAGAIIKGKGSVRGLTTAASLWLVNAIGLTVGAGAYLLAIITTVISIIFLYVFRLIFRPSFVRETYRILTITCTCPVEQLEKIKAILVNYNVEIQNADFFYDIEKTIYTIKLRLRMTDDISVEKLVENILVLENIKSIIWEEAPVP